MTACSFQSEDTSSNPEDIELEKEEADNQSKQEESSKDEDTNDTENVETIEETNNKEHEPKYQLRESDWSLQPIDDAENRNVLITIDDAPDSYSLEMAETLKEEDVPAIFFVNGHFLQDEQGREDLKAIHDLGFEIGNHTMNHVSLNTISEQETLKEIHDLNDLIEDITGERPAFFRAPFGINTDHSKEILKEEEMIWMNWTYGYDWEEGYMEADSLADIMVDTELLKNGANLLMHDREWTKEALPSIIEGFREKGYGFIHPGEIEQ